MASRTRSTPSYKIHRAVSAHQRHQVGAKVAKLRCTAPDSGRATVWQCPPSPGPGQHLRQLALRASRSCGVTSLLIPPGTAPVPCTRLPEVMRMTSWPNLRSKMPFLAISGCACATPTHVRCATPNQNQTAGRARTGGKNAGHATAAFAHSASAAAPASALAAPARRQSRGQTPCCRQMVRHRADAAQALHHHRHFPVGAAFNEFLEAPKLHDVQARLLHLVVLVQQQGDLAMPLNA
jgi:hypothetical protein